MALSVQHPTMSLSSPSPTLSTIGNLTSGDVQAATPQFSVFWIQFWLSIFAILAICWLALFGFWICGMYFERKLTPDATSIEPGRSLTSCLTSSSQHCGTATGQPNRRHRRRCRNGCAERAIQADRAAAATLRGESANCEQEERGPAAVTARRGGGEGGESSSSARRDDGYDSQVELRSWLTPEIHTASCFLSRSPSPTIPGPSATGAQRHAVVCTCTCSLHRDQTRRGLSQRQLEKSPEVNISINDSIRFVSDHLAFTSDAEHDRDHDHDHCSNPDSFMDLEAGLALVPYQRQTTTPEMFNPRTYDDLGISDNASSSTHAAAPPGSPPLSFITTPQGDEYELQDLDSAAAGTSATTFRSHGRREARENNPQQAGGPRAQLSRVFSLANGLVARLFPGRDRSFMSSATTVHVANDTLITTTTMTTKITGLPAFPETTYFFPGRQEQDDPDSATATATPLPHPQIRSGRLGRGSQTLPLLPPAQETQIQPQTRIVKDSSGADNNNGNQAKGSSSISAPRKRSETLESKQSSTSTATSSSAFSHGGSSTAIGSGSGSNAGGDCDQGIELQEFV